MFLSPLPHALLYYKANMLLMDLIRRFNQQAWNKILNIKPSIHAIGQMSGTWQLLMHDYGGESMVIGENKYFQ